MPRSITRWWRNGRVFGAVTADGREHRANIVISNLNPKLLYRDIVPQQHLDDDLKQRVQTYRCGSGTFRMNVALSKLPDFHRRAGHQPASASPERHPDRAIAAIFRAGLLDAKSKEHNAGWARKPIVEVVISSTLDDTLAPKGQHVASLFCQQVNPEVDGGWDAHRDTVAKLMIDAANDYASNFRASVLGYEALSPLDLERRFGLIGGDIFHGALGPDQMFTSRPFLGQSQLSRRAGRASIYVDRAAIPVAASLACRDATPRAKSSATCTSDRARIEPNGLDPPRQ